MDVYLYMLLVEGSEYKEQQPYWFCQDSIQMGLYTLAAEVCRRTVNTNHFDSEFMYKHVVRSLIYTYSQIMFSIEFVQYRQLKYD